MFLAFAGTAWAQDIVDSAASIPATNPMESSIRPQPKAITLQGQPEPQGVQWKSLLNHSARFLVFEHAFRYATEPGTRHPGRPFFQGYIDSVGSLHGWSDGDPFYVNYVGHPMQGAVSAYLWTFSDTRYRNVEFGRSGDYWKSRLRAGAFAWVYSTQMEIGPISEASIGNVQALYPQQGLVDHVVTPAIGLGWMIAEDALDRYLVRWVERKTQHPWVRILVRGGANPSRSFANVFAGKAPWARARDQHLGYLISVGHAVPQEKKSEGSSGNPGIAPVEFSANFYGLTAPSGTCVGGGASVAFHIASQWQSVVDVNGCKMAGLSANLTGDYLSYMAGPRWTLPSTGRLVPYWQFLAGGSKVTQELLIPELSASNGDVPPDHGTYTRQFEHDGFAIAGGMGLDLHYNRAMALRLIEVDYTRSWVNGLDGFGAPHGFQLKMGFVLHLGTW
jgi:hypothetical protein